MANQLPNHGIDQEGRKARTTSRTRLESNDTMMNSECDELLSEILSHPSLNAPSSLNAAVLQSSEEESESESGLFLANETQFAPGTIGRGSRNAKPKQSLLRRQKAEIKAQMKDLHAKIYQNQLMSLAGFSLGSYPLFNGPPQTHHAPPVNLNPGAYMQYQMPTQQIPSSPQNHHVPVTPQLQQQHPHQSQQAPDMLHMIKQQQEQIELLKNQLNPNFNHQMRNQQVTPSEDISFSRPASSKNRYRNDTRTSRIEVPDNVSSRRSFSRASTCSNRSKAPKPALRKLLPTFERSPKLHVRRLASLMFPRSESCCFLWFN
ncbi:unnamed protein product [Oikopleura dioica]|uniref:Uncharacterized protein n=1 Tax=Oikopleura dioica TaxID=34765 RepID=E4YG70_OIKDI|nr:unnamed protein product [Oikopleura dioica]